MNTIPKKTLITAYPCEFERLLETFTQTANAFCSPTGYEIDEDNRKQIELILRYFIGDKTIEAEGIFLHKGLMLYGNVGTGKTLLMEIIRKMSNTCFPDNYFQMVRARDLVLAYESHGSKGIERYIWNTENTTFGSKKPFALCLDDIGIGNEKAYYFGNYLNVIAEIFLGRYAVVRDWNNRKITHITTNLNADKIEELYGNRVRSRLREMFNPILFTGKDRRK